MSDEFHMKLHKLSKKADLIVLLEIVFREVDIKTQDK